MSSRFPDFASFYPFYLSQHRDGVCRTLHVLGVFFAAWLVMPGVPALAGFAPTPPAAPTMGYGSVPGPYTLEQYRSPINGNGQPPINLQTLHNKCGCVCAIRCKH